MIHRNMYVLAVPDLLTSATYYRDVLGFDMGISTNFDGNEQLMNTAGTPGAQFKRTVMRIPGTTVQTFLLEFRNIDRKKLPTRTQDPGTPILQLRAPDVDAVVAAWKAAGGEVVSKGGIPANMNGVKLVLLRDPNGVMLEILPAPRPQPAK